MLHLIATVSLSLIAYVLFMTTCGLLWIAALAVYRNS